MIYKCNAKYQEDMLSILTMSVYSTPLTGIYKWIKMHDALIFNYEQNCRQIAVTLGKVKFGVV